jgi:hypothetical protein
VDHDDLLPIAERIAALMRRNHAGREAQAHRGEWERSREARLIDSEIGAAKEEARQRFGAARGWVRTNREFHTDGVVRGLHHSPLYTGHRRPTRDGRDIRVALGRPWIDHTEHYRTPGRGGVCAGIVSHAYLWVERSDLEARAVAYAEGAGLRCEVYPPAYSWYYPGETTLLVFTRHSAEVVPIRPDLRQEA